MSYANRNASDVGTEALARLAGRYTNTKAERAVADGTHEWVWDPEVREVVGLIRKGTNRADIVIYLDALDGEGDFEVSDEWS
jgi:hypothetical protein